MNWKRISYDALSVLLFVALVGGLLGGVWLAFGDEEASVPCARDGKPCVKRRECTLCTRCATKDECCCRHVDRCSCDIARPGEDCCARG